MLGKSEVDTCVILGEVVRGTCESERACASSTEAPGSAKVYPWTIRTALKLPTEQSASSARRQHHN